MFDHHHYVPLLKGKKGEFDALSQIDQKKIMNMTPLIEVPPIDWDYANERPKKTIDEHISTFPAKLSKAWGNERALFIDLYYIEPGDKTESGQHPLIPITDSLRQEDVKSIPVTAISRTDDFQQAVKDIVSKDNRGVCFRVFDYDCYDLNEVKSQLDTLLALFDLTHNECDVILDMRNIQEASHTEASKYMAILKNFPYVKEWRSLTFAGSSFPESLAAVERDSSSQISRNEFKLWKQIRKATDLPRIPSFGDYGIAHSELNDVDPRTMRMSANLRYTLEEDWLIFKGRDARRYGFPQFNGLCRKLVSHPGYRGQAFSWGDKSIYACSLRNDKPGNASTWRALGTNQHIVFVASQVASHF